MAQNGGRINYSIGFIVDKQAIQSLQNDLAIIENKAKMPGKNLSQNFKDAAATAETLGKILDKSFNRDLGALNISKFNQELKKANLTLTDVKAKLTGAGVDGTRSYQQLASAVLGANLELKNTSKFLTDIAHSFTETARWQAVNSIINKISGSIQSAVGYVENLDKSLMILELLQISLLEIWLILQFKQMKQQKH